jgi:hypothetical protein
VTITLSLSRKLLLSNFKSSYNGSCVVYDLLPVLALPVNEQLLECDLDWYVVVSIYLGVKPLYIRIDLHQTTRVHCSMYNSRREK